MGKMVPGDTNTTRGLPYAVGFAPVVFMMENAVSRIARLNVKWC